MDTKYLSYILTIARRQNMTKAAEQLYVSQSSLSQYLSKLESEIGTPLFFRSKGRLSLTPAGELYVQAAEQVLQIKNSLYHNIQHLDNKGHITIGVTSEFGLRMLTELIPPFKRKYPNITIEISELNVPTLTQMLLDENIDCGIMALNTIAPFKPEQVDILRQEEVLLAIPKTHPFYAVKQEGTITISELKEYFSNDNILLSKKASTLRVLSDELLEKAHLILQSVCETNSVSATRSMVAMGIGITLIAESCVEDQEHIAYYSLEPKQYRLNAFVRRRNWTLMAAEEQLHQNILHYFNTDTD